MVDVLNLRDLRIALRTLRRSPGFAAVTIAVLALGIGASTAVFSLVNGILLEPLPYPNASRLVRLTHTVSNAATPVDQSDALVLLYQAEARAFDGVAAWRFDDGDLSPTDPGQRTVRVHGARVTANFFDVLGVRPALGTAFAAGEDRPRHNGVVVLSYHIWQERFHGDPRAVGREIVVNDVRRRIVGIMPPRFAYPARGVELWLPLALDPGNTHPATFDLVGIGRLAPGVSMQAARADLGRVLTHAGETFNGGASLDVWHDAHVVPRVESLRDSIVGPIAQLLWIVFGSVLLVLVVACTNVAALILVRAERTDVELAIRRALGSGFAGLLATALAESTLLSVAGGIVGVLLATLSMHVAVRAGVALSLPRLEDVRAGGPVLLFALGATLLCALLVSVLPLVRARRVSVAQVLRGAGGGSAGGPTRQRARQILIVAQVALALVLVASSGLMVRSFVRLSNVAPGFDADHVVASRVLLPYARYGGTASRLAFYQSLTRQARAIPAARVVALTNWVPLSGDAHDTGLEVEGTAGGGGGTSHAVASVDGEYFRALRIPLLWGRVFGAPDATRPSDEIIVSRAFAERYWPGASPLGRRVRPVGGPWYTVVGEVGDVHYDALDTPATEIVYFPIVTAAPASDGTFMPSGLAVVVRSDGTSQDALSAIRRIVQGLDPAVPTYDETSLNTLVTDSAARARALVVLLASASIVTLLLATIGLYGVVAYIVSSRRRELGIRLALGAKPADVRRMVSLDGLRLAVVGVAIGMVAALGTTHLLRGLLFGVSPLDVTTLTIAPMVLLCIAAAASWIPARRAAAIDPAETLRAQ